MNEIKHMKNMEIVYDSKFAWYKPWTWKKSVVGIVFDVYMYKNPKTNRKWGKGMISDRFLRDEDGNALNSVCPVWNKHMAPYINNPDYPYTLTWNVDNSYIKRFLQYMKYGLTEVYVNDMPGKLQLCESGTKEARIIKMKCMAEEGQ